MKIVFGNLVAVRFKVFFAWKCIKAIYFLFFKIIFDINTSKQCKNKKKKQIFSKIRFEPRSQTMRIKSSQHRITVAKNKYVL